MSIRSYNAFLRAVKAREGLSHKQAQAAYRVMGARLGRAPKGIDVKRHPRITKASARDVRSGAGRKAGRRKRPAKPAPTLVPEPLRRINTIAEWNRLYESSTDRVRIRVVSSADYGRSRKGRR